METKTNTLLIADDESSNLKVLSHILSPEYTIYTAANGTDAIEKAKEYVPDLILLDILMPDKNGYETLCEIKKIEKLRKIPVIFITGLDSDEDEEKGLSLDAADYITKPFSPIVVKLRVRNQIQIITQLRTIERLIYIDQLTNLPNRRCFDERLTAEWKRAIREQTPISVLMMDLDKFKKLNDTYGHQQGDIVLQKAASIFINTIKRPGDLAARWGGEEFVVLLPNTQIEGAVQIAEEIRANVEKTAIQCEDGVEINVTISIGVNSIAPAKTDSVIAFLSGADNGLYAAKNAGRNTVKRFSR